METQTRNITIHLADDPDDDIRIARMEMELFPWRQELKKDGYRVVKFDMTTVDSETAHDDQGGIHLLTITFAVTVHIEPKEK